MYYFYFTIDKFDDNALVGLQFYDRADDSCPRAIWCSPHIIPVPGHGIFVIEFLHSQNHQTQFTLISFLVYGYIGRERAIMINTKKNGGNVLIKFAMQIAKRVHNMGIPLARFLININHLY